MAYQPVVNQGTGNASTSPWSVSGYVRGSAGIGQAITDINAPFLVAINDKGGIARLFTSANAVSGTTGQGLAGAGNLVLGPDAIWRGMQGDNLGNTKVIQSFTGTNVSGNSTVTLKNGSGLLHSVSINSKGASANTCKIYDNTSGGGNLIANIDTTSSLNTLTYDATFSTGLTVVVSGGTAGDLTISWM